jgi:hypothetical protein
MNLRLKLIDQQWMTEKETAEKLRVKVATLRAWRLKSRIKPTGPRFFKVGSKLWYVAADVEAFAQQSYVRSCNHVDNQAR